MGSIRNVYTATNINTGEQIEGHATEIAERIGTCAERVRKGASRYCVVSGQWRIEIVGEIQRRTSGKAGVYKRWDEFTEPIRERIRQRDERMENGKERY